MFTENGGTTFDVVIIQIFMYALSGLTMCSILIINEDCVHRFSFDGYMVVLGITGLKTLAIPQLDYERA